MNQKKKKLLMLVFGCVLVIIWHGYRIKISRIYPNLLCFEIWQISRTLGAGTHCPWNEQKNQNNWEIEQQMSDHTCKFPWEWLKHWSPTHMTYENTGLVEELLPRVCVWVIRTDMAENKVRENLFDSRFFDLFNVTSCFENVSTQTTPRSVNS